MNIWKSDSEEVADMKNESENETNCASAFEINNRDEELKRTSRQVHKARQKTMATGKEGQARNGK